MVFAGGVPLKRGDQVIGGVGVSGGTGEQDLTVVEAAARSSRVARGSIVATADVTWAGPSRSA